jgi:hypothetical protein
MWTISLSICELDERGAYICGITILSRRQEMLDTIQYICDGSIAGGIHEVIHDDVIVNIAGLTDGSQDTVF